MTTPNIWTFKVPGDPVPWTVWARRGPPPTNYLRMQSWQAQIQAYARQYGPRTPIKGPVRLQMEFYLPWPKSAPKSNDRAKQRYRCLHRTKRPDLRNYTKACEDAMNGISYVDDGQVICAGPDIKDFGIDAKEGWTIITVEALTDAPN
jgi:crossover junction endodeoxyribonuclease RusA